MLWRWFLLRCFGGAFVEILRVAFSRKLRVTPLNAINPFHVNVPLATESVRKPEVF